MNNAVPTSPLLQQMGHPHSYPSLGQISNPYEQQPPGKELNKYASLKAVGKCRLASPLSTSLFLPDLSLQLFSIPFSIFLIPLFLHLSVSQNLSFFLYLSSVSFTLYLPINRHPLDRYILGLYLGYSF